MRDDEHVGRRSIRLPEYDYTQEGAYFITICTAGKRHLFGEIDAARMRFNELGHVADACWLEIPRHNRNVGLDYFVIMPNHVHGIFFITEQPKSPIGNIPQVTVWAQQAAPRRVPRVIPHSLGAIVRSYKSAVSRKIHSLACHECLDIWQRNYYEHVIRNEDDLRRTREYIANNPAQWALDEYYEIAWSRLTDQLADSGDPTASPTKAGRVGGVPMF